MHQVIDEKGSLSGLYPRFKTDKSNRTVYDKSLTNIVYLPSTFTGVPIIGVNPREPSIFGRNYNTILPKLPFLLIWKPTHLTERLGKYMVTTPMADYKSSKSTCQSTLGSASHPLHFRKVRHSPYAPSK